MSRPGRDDQGRDPATNGANAAAWERSVTDEIVVEANRRLRDANPARTRGTTTPTPTTLFESAASAVFRRLTVAARGSLSVTDIGRTYEHLLELVPRLTDDQTCFSLEARAPSAHHRAERASARRTSGSYYTPEPLIDTVLERALTPQIERALTSPEPEAALLRIRVVDPACGTGYFLLAAARLLSARLAELRSPSGPSRGGPRRGEGSEHAMRRARVDVVTHCIHGVDSNPLAVELCKLSLRLLLGDAELSRTALDSKIRLGNALLGAWPEDLAVGLPDAAWAATPGDDKAIATRLRRKNRSERAGNVKTTSDPTADLVRVPEAERERLLRDTWCAAFVWPALPDFETSAPTQALWTRLRDEGCLPRSTLATVRELVTEYRFFHWSLEYPEVFALGDFEQSGFDAVLGNPPWIAHAGRAAQKPAGRSRRFFESQEAFADYPTTHGMFVAAAPLLLRVGGSLGFVIPASVSELDGYAPTRRAHDRRCSFPRELVDFGEGQFPGVVQPCMALVSVRTPAGRTDVSYGAAWPMERPDLDATSRGLLARLAKLPTLPDELFGERGLQSDRALRAHFTDSQVPTGRFTTAIREGADVRELTLLPPRFHVDRAALGSRLRSAEEFARVRVVIRQTARYPIAALADGVAFRNSLLAGFDHPELPPDALVALLNSALVRWLHYQRFRDARQPVMPQVKIAHLRAIPVPVGGIAAHAPKLATLGERAQARMALVGGPRADTEIARSELDACVAQAYGLTSEEEAVVVAWHQRMRPSGAGRGP